MQKRTLTVSFERAVYADTPNMMEVSITPLTTPYNGAANTVLAGGAQTKLLLLADGVNSVTFSLVPSDHDDLSKPMPYRIAWRERYTGRQFSADFSMPDADTNFADLDGMGLIHGSA